MKTKKKPAALSQVEYLERKLTMINDKINEIEESCNPLPELMELYFQKGKLFSELELMKRVPSYD
jgi:hypothetical protein